MKKEEFEFFIQQREKTVEKTVEKTSEKTSEKILALIANNKNITIEEIASFTNRTTRAIEMNIEKLKQEGKIKRIGPDKGGYWEVVE